MPTHKRRSQIHYDIYGVPLAQHLGVHASSSLFATGIFEFFILLHNGPLRPVDKGGREGASAVNVCDFRPVDKGGGGEGGREPLQ